MNTERSDAHQITRSGPTQDGSAQTQFAQVRPCELCGKPFDVTKRRTRFCSRYCAVRQKKPGVSARLRIYNKTAEKRADMSKLLKGRKCPWNIARNLVDNPVYKPGVAEKISRTKIGKPSQGPAFRMGMRTQAQLKLAGQLGKGWEMEHQVTAGAARNVFSGLKQWYAIDIANRDLKIAIELDGPYHMKARAQEKDRKKEALLKYHGWSVLRFKDAEVETNMDGVMAAIATCIASR